MEITEWAAPVCAWLFEHMCGWGTSEEMAPPRVVRKGNMKKTGMLFIAGMVTIGAAGLFIHEARSETEVSATVQISAPTDFYQPLGTCGSWSDVDGYGHCFQPAGVGPGWQPYCEGSWVSTDCGWYWQSDEPWAWACYHYGTWVDAPGAGWIWVPGIEWAPAWVTWRTGGSFVGWAPCAPRGVTVAPALFVFVGVDHFQDPIRRTSVTVNNATAIGQTRVLAAPGREQRTIDGRAQEVVINRGPDVDAVQKASGRKVSPMPIGEAMQRTVMPKNVTPSGRPAEPAKMNRPVEPDKGKPQPPATDRRSDNPPARQQDLTPERPTLTPERPVETRPPSSDLPERAPAQEIPAPPPREGQQLPQQAPRELQQPPREQVPQKPALKPVNPPKEEKPAPEEKPASPPPQQQDKDRKDGLGRSASMLAEF